MSQVSIVDVVGNNPEIPTDFVTDSGNAIPIANTLEILGTYVVAGTTPVETTGSGNTVTIEVQLSNEVLAPDVTQVGLCNFDSGAFTVDANGFVTLNGGGGAATDIDVDASTPPGTDPVVPDGLGHIMMTGAQVATGVVGTNVIRTNSLAANSVTLEIQRSTAVAASDSTKNGVAHFDSADFSVDGNGFVGLTASAFTEGSVIFMGPTALSQDNANFFWDNTENRLGIGTNTPLETVHVDGNMLIDHTAAENDDHALEIICDSAGFSDVKAVDIDFITGAVAAGEQDEVILINIDETEAVGGQIVALQVISTTEGTDAVIALKCGPGIDAIRQEVGTFGDMDSADNDGANVLAALIAGGPGNVSVFVADNDTLTIGNAISFGALEILVDTPASGAGIAPTFRYSTGIAAWSPFGPADGTNGFKNTGVIEWDVNDLAGFAPGAGAEYLIEIKRTRNVLTTTPIIDEVQISALTEFKWDKDGNVNLNSLTLVTPLVVSSGGTGAASLTDHGIMLGSGIGAVTVTAAPTNGQLLIGSTGADPVLASLTSTGGSVTITPGAGTINLEVAAGNDAILTLTGDSGGALSPTAGNINTLGTGSITIAGSGSTLTTQLTGLTVNSVLYGLGTATVGLVASGTTGQVLQTNTGAAPTYSSATYPSSTTVSQILYSSATNVVTGLATANSGVLITDSGGIPSISNSLTISNSATTLGTLTCTDAGAAAGPIVDFYRDSASPAASDITGQIIFNGEDSAGNKQEYARIDSKIIATTSTAENGGLQFYTTSAGTATKQIDLLNTGGQYRGNNTNTAPPAGFIGEQIRSYLSAGSKVTLVASTAKNVTSISLTAGIWDVSCVCVFSGSNNSTVSAAGVSSVSATLGTNGDDVIVGSVNSTNFDCCYVVPSYRYTLSSTTTIYMVGYSTFGTGSAYCYGRISGTRVG